MRKLPLNGGIDMAGLVVSSGDSRFKADDSVIVHAYGMGVTHDGGFSEFVRVPADWVVKMPKGMTPFEAMGIGTAGFTAALALYQMERQGLKQGPIAVTGATGGVGSIALEILSKKGYYAVAITSKEDKEGYLKDLGAQEVRFRKMIDLNVIRPLEKALWAGGIDNVGGSLLAWLLSTCQPGGVLTSIGLADSAELHMTVMPFILRGVSLLGIDSANCAIELRQKIWDQLAMNLPIKVLSQVKTIAFDDLPSHFAPFLKGQVTGRIVVKF